MNRFLLSSLCLVTVFTLAVGIAQAKDVVYTTDGRVLEGEVLREDDRRVVFRYLDPDLGFEATITLPRSAIEKLERNVSAPETNPVSDRPKETSPEPQPTTPSASPSKETRSSSEGSTRFYVVPMRGTVGTDITARIYDEISEDIKQQRPDVVIIQLDSSDLRNEFQDGEDDIIEGDTRHLDPREQNSWDRQNIQDVRLAFVNNLPRDIRQVLWVRDAVGSSAIYAVSWPELYMHPEANLGGLSSYVVRARAAAGDADVAAKWGDASYGWIRGMAAYGQDRENPNPTRDKLLAALCKPELFLSVSWKGRMPIWRNDLKGEIVLDNDDEAVVTLNAIACDDLCMTKGTAETIEDLAVLLGERQFEIVEGIAQRVTQEHHENWRSAFDRAMKKYREYQKWMKRVSGPTAMGNLRKAETALKTVLMLAKKWPEVQARAQPRGLFDVVRLQILLEEIKRIRKDNGRGGGRGGGGGGGGGLGNR